MKNLDEIVKDISKFIKYWEKLSDEDSTREFHRRYEHLCYYWRVVKDALFLSVELVALFWDGFWLIMRFASTLEDQFVEDGNVCKEYDEDDHFIGQRRDRPALSFRVSGNLFEGYFVVV
jgi:hypothetical protein